MRLKLLATSSLIILMAGSLSACTTNQNKTTSETPMGDMNQPVNYQATADSQEPATSAEREQQLRNLRPGQPVNYYNSEFNRLGFSIVDVNSMKEQRTYDLRKGNDRYVVSLILPNDQDRVSQIDIQQYRLQGETRTTSATDTQQGAQQTQTTRTSTTLPAEIQNLKPGKQPYEYIPTVAKYGQVREYDADKQKAEIEFEGKDRERYHIRMQVDPQTQKVTSIDINQPIWRAF